MAVLKSAIDVTSTQFASNRGHMVALLQELRQRTGDAALGGSDASPGTPFMEIGALAAFGMYDDEAPGAGLITGIGRV